MLFCFPISRIIVLIHHTHVNKKTIENKSPELKSGNHLSSDLYAHDENRMGAERYVTRPTGQYFL